MYIDGNGKVFRSRLLLKNRLFVYGWWLEACNVNEYRLFNNPDVESLVDTNSCS